MFWMALGLAVGHSARLQVPRDVPEEVVSGSPGTPKRVARLRWTIALLLGGLLVFSVPFRARQELAAVDLTHVSYGFYGWGTEPDGTRCRWSGPRATLYVDGRARLVEIPLGSTTPSDVLQQVEVRVDGRLANRIAVGPEWQRLRMLLPSTPSTGPRRIDFTVSPSWIPAETIPGSQDRRVLGVKVGALTVTMAPEQSR